MKKIWKNQKTEKKVRKEIEEELSTDPIPLTRTKTFKETQKRFYGKSWLRLLPHIINNIFFTDMNKFQKEEKAQKRTLSKNTCYDWLINYIAEPNKDNVITPEKKFGVILK